jgi:hypothetical protein
VECALKPADNNGKGKLHLHTYKKKMEVCQKHLQLARVGLIDLKKCTNLHSICITGEVATADTKAVQEFSATLKATIK